MTLCTVPASLGTHSFSDALWWHTILRFRSRVAGYHAVLPASNSTGNGAHRLANNFCGTLREMSFGEAMGSTINR